MRATPSPREKLRPRAFARPPADSASTGNSRRWAAFDRLQSQLREWESLPLADQFRLAAVISVASTLLLAYAVMVIWELARARDSVMDRVDELGAQIVRAAESGPVERSLLATLVANPVVLAARLEGQAGGVISEYLAEDAPSQAFDVNPGVVLSLRRLLWLAPKPIDRSLYDSPGADRTLRVVVDSSLLWQRVAGHMAMLPLLAMIGWFVARHTERVLRRVSRRMTDPLARLAVATRGGQWKSSDQLADAFVSADPVAEIIDNFEAMRERLGEHERRVAQSRRDAEVEVGKRTAELEQRVQAAERASAGMGDFLASMSHEIRTPMNGVVGMAELLSRTALDERQQRFLRSMRAASDSMVKIINDILDVTKIESGNMEFVPEPCNLRELVEEVGQLYAARAQTKGLELVCYIEPGVPEVVSADVLRLRQVLSNLVSNAVKYTERGEIVVRASDGETSDGRHLVYFEVSDTGPGIPQDQQAIIFEPYKQLNNASTQTGTGLGLPIALRLVKLMGGSGIDLHSTPGHGCRFVFWLPCAVVEARRKVQPRASIRGLRVLVVDDNSTSYLFLEDTISSWGADVTVLTHGKLLRDRMATALQERAPFDAVVLDHSLPDVPLRDLLAVIRLDSQFRSTHVILLSALEFEADPGADTALVPDICIAKPVRQQALVDALELARIPRDSKRTRREESDEAGRAPALGGVGGLRVLVVDDNAINREVAAAMLEERGCRVVLAQEGSEAVALAGTETFDLILMDCQMPGLDGYAATENIRREESMDGRSATQIVALTANVLPRDRERCLDAGMDDVLVKPFSGEQLDGFLQRAAQNARGRRGSRGDNGVAAADEKPLQTMSGGLAPEFDLFKAPEPAGELEAQEPVLDRDQIASILGLRKPQLLAQLCGMLEERAPAALRRIETALAEGDLPTVRTAAHELRSPVATLGGRRFAALLGRCERAAADGRLDDAMLFGRHLAQAYHVLNQALDAALARHGAERTGT